MVMGQETLETGVRTPHPKHYPVPRGAPNAGSVVLAGDVMQEQWGCPWSGSHG